MNVCSLSVFYHFYNVNILYLFKTQYKFIIIHSTVYFVELGHSRRLRVIIRRMQLRNSIHNGNQGDSIGVEVKRGR